MSALPPGLARAFWPLLLAVTAWALWQGYDQLNDRRAAARHEAIASAQVAEAQLQAEREANRQDDIRQATRQSRSGALRRAREEAIDDQRDPGMAGPAVSAVLRELRAQADQDRGAAR